VNGGVGRYWRPMGLNPFRPQSVSRADVAMVVGAVLVVAALVAWAIFG